MSQTALKPLRPHQVQALDALKWSIVEGKRRPMVQAPTGAGKCLGLGTPVMHFDGRVTPVESVCVGDTLMGPDSLPRTVLSTCRGAGDLFRITPAKGNPWVCNDVHVLTLVETGTGRVEDIALDDYLLKSRTYKHTRKLFAPPEGVDFSGDVDPDIDPYFAGVWVGDGTKLLRGVSVSKPDAEIRQVCEAVADSYGLSVRTDFGSSGCPTYHLHGGRRGGVENKLLSTLRGLFSGKKFPHSIKTASRLYRQEFLAGVIDTDGYVSHGGVEIVQRNESLADGIAFIARSLGLRVSVSSKVVGGSSYRRMAMSGDFSGINPRIPRKRIPARQQIKTATRTGFSVTAIGRGDYAGFELDGDGRFLLGDFTVTHNTVLAAHIVAGARAKGKRVAFCVPSISLVDQTFERFVENGIDPADMGVIQADHPWRRAHAPIQIATAQSLARRDRPDADVIVIDEAHVRHKVYETWMAEEPGKVFIGLSATPWARGLGCRFDQLVKVTTTAELIAAGLLSPFKVYAPSHPDLTGVGTIAGDYHEGQLGEVMSGAALVADVVTNWQARGKNRPTLCFAVNRAHAQKLADQFKAAGIPTAYIDATTPREERDDIGRQLATGEIKVVVNIGCLTTGIDWDVRCLILARPTKSESLFVQIIGRALRTAPGKDHAIILDHSDTHLRLGMVTDIDFDDLDTGKEAKAAKDRKRERKLPKPRLCNRCTGLVPATVDECPCCGTPMPRPTRVRMIEGELAEFGVKPKGGKPLSVREEVARQGRQAVYSQLLWVARERGRKSGWVAHAYKGIFSVWPSRLQDIPAEPTGFVISWLRSRDIAWAKANVASKEVSHAV